MIGRCATGYRSGVRILLGLLLEYGAIQGDDRPAGDLKRYVTPEYVLYTDLSDDAARQVLARLVAMTDLYRQWTGDLAGAACNKLSFYLYGRYDDYLASFRGQRPTSAGRYDGVSLCAVADTNVFSEKGIWRVVQHEGWHQFSHRLLQREAPLPIWLEEGLAEYFGGAALTGDRLIPGAIDAERMRRVQRRIGAKQFRPLRKLVAMSRDEWSEAMNIVNYDQVGSVMQFLTRKHPDALKAYFRDMVLGRANLPSFRTHFGRNLKTLQKQYETWWLSLPDRPSAKRDDQITVETLMAFLRRLARQGRTFDSAEAFFQAARQGRCVLPARPPDGWLLPTLLAEALTKARQHENWRLRYDSNHRPVLTLTREDGTVFRARCISGKKIPVRVEITPARPTPTTAQSPEK